MGRKKKKKPASEKNQTPLKDTTLKQEPAKQNKKPKFLQRMEGPNRVLAGLAAAGMILTAYLVITGWLDKAPVLCNDGSSCDIVQKSRWGTFLAMPTAFWGFLTYATLFYIGIMVRNTASHWKSAWVISMAGLGYSVYLITISILVIKAACGYCIASFLIMCVIFGVVTFQWPGGMPKFNFKAFAREAVIITAVIVGGMHMHYSGIFDPMAGPEDPFLKGLAIHLAEDQAVLYGAYW